MTGSFLWKPEGEHTGKLVVLATGPSAVNLADMNTGEIIEYGAPTGASNGYGGTFRFSQPGAAYKNVAVVDQAGNIIQQIGEGAGRVQGVVQDLGPLNPDEVEQGSTRPGFADVLLSALMTDQDPFGQGGLY